MTTLNASVIAGFVGSVLGSRFDGQSSTPDFHKECWELCCSKEKFVAIAAPRGHAKSTAITLGYGLATLLFRERKFMLLVSDTESQASLFLGTFKQELQDNNELIDLFRIKRGPNGLVKFPKDSETDIVVECEDGHQFRIIAKGAEQKLRGLIWNGSRPDIIMCDDMENDELVMNKERREKMRRWFKGALLPCRSDNGVVRMVGTILHNDSLLERLMPNDSDKQTQRIGLKTFTTRRGMWKAVKYRAHNEDFSELLWASKKSREEFQMLYEEAVKDGTTDIYSQEYLNVPLDESVTFFKKTDFLPMKEEDHDSVKHYYLTVDLAIAENERADYSVFMIGAVDENRIIHIVDVVRDRLDGKEIVDTILSLERIYHFEAVGIEDMQVSKAIGPFLREEMIASNTFPTLYPLKHGGKDKIARARSIQARLRAHGIRFNKEGDWYPLFENECLTFPRGKHDDQVDTFAYLGMMLDRLIEAPTKEEIEEEEYNDELRDSEFWDAGRSAITGY
jgi:predicted phage terminase large subunit-like protein